MTMNPISLSNIPVAIFFLSLLNLSGAFQSTGLMNEAAFVRSSFLRPMKQLSRCRRLRLSDRDPSNEVIELADTPIKKEETVAPSAPFLSQAAIAEDAMSMDMGDLKQLRVILYIVVSLLPVLFLIPFMLSREFLPIDSLPPVEM